MEYTEKFGLGKPDKSEFYDVDVQNKNMDIIEEELGNRPTSDGDAGDMAVEFEQASSAVSLTSGEKLRVSLGKIAKAIADFITHIATSATTSVSGHVKFGTTSGTACQGNDSRLSDARTPISHASTGTEYGVGTTSNYGHLKLSTSSAVTSDSGLALSAKEKNASVSGTLANLINKRLPLAGGTMTGNINIIKSGDAQIYLKDTDSGAMHGTLVANQNEIGMYSNTNSKWIWYHTADGVSQFDGNASTATTANEARRLWVIDGLAYNGGTAGWGYESDYCDKNGVRVGYINTQYMGNGTVNFVIGADKGSVLIHGNNSNIATANKAACDWNGNNIVNTYFPKAGGTVNGNVAVTGDVCCNHYCTSTSGATMKIETGGFLNLQTAQSAQVRNQDDTGWAAISASSFVNQSSKRYKKNIVDMSEERARGILKMRPVNYDYINEVDGTDCLGLIAEEVDEVEKYPVMYNENGEPEGIDYSRLVPMLIKMIQMQEERITALENK